MLHELHQRLTSLHVNPNDADDDDMKPVMMRALTDLFTSRPHHTPDEIAQFEEFGARLLDKIDAGTLAIVARKLAPYALTPRPIIDRLLRHGGPAAAAVLEFAPDVDRGGLIAAVTQGCAESAAAVARRANIDEEIVLALGDRPEIEVLRALAENAGVKPGEGLTRKLVRRARRDAPLAAAMLKRNLSGADAAALYLYANAIMRAEILRGARGAGLGAIGLTEDAPTPPAVIEIEQNARDRDWSRFAFRLGLTLALKIEDVRRIMGDASGEALAVALAAAGASPGVAERIFMCREPAIAHSYRAILALSGLVGSLTQDEARDLLAAMFSDEERPPVRRRAGAHQPYYDQQAAAVAGRAQRAPSYVAPGSGAAAMVSRLVQRER